MRKKNRVPEPDRIQIQDQVVYNQMIEMTMNGDPNRSLGLVLCAIHERQGEMIRHLQEIEANSFRR